MSHESSGSVIPSDIIGIPDSSQLQRGLGFWYITLSKPKIDVQPQTNPGAGASPVVVFQAVPGGTCQSP